MADSEAPALKVCGHMEAELSESDSSSDESSQDDIEVEFREASWSATDVIDNNMQPPAMEMGGIMMADLPPTPNRNEARCALATNAPANAGEGPTMERQPVDNAFGIRYKPSGASSKQGYELPAGPAFVDEDEFEQEMGAEFRVVLGSSGGSSETPITSDAAQSENISSKTGVDIDDFSDDEGYDCRAEEQKASSRRRRFAPTYTTGMRAPRDGCWNEGMFEFDPNFPSTHKLPTLVYWRKSDPCGYAKGLLALKPTNRLTNLTASFDMCRLFVADASYSFLHCFLSPPTQNRKYLIVSFRHLKVCRLANRAIFRNCPQTPS